MKFELTAWVVGIVAFGIASLNNAMGGSVGNTVMFIGLSLIIITGAILLNPQEKK